MTIETAAHLNELLINSAPIKFSSHFKLVSGANLAKKLWPQLAGIAAKYLPKIIEEEITSAAKEGRIAQLGCSEHTFHEATSGIEDPLTYRAWVAASDEILAIVEADNAKRMKEYEEYRKACINGTAVPPIITKG